MPVILNTPDEIDTWMTAELCPVRLSSCNARCPTA
jgi:hypothetical protein